MRPAERVQVGFLVVGVSSGSCDHDCKFSVHEVREACKTVRPAERVQVGFLVVGGSSGSCDVIYPSPTVGLLGERPAVSGGCARRRNEKSCIVEQGATHLKDQL